MISCRDWWPWTKPGLYHYDPETKQQSMEWRHSGSPSPQKIQVQKSPRNVLASIFWDQDEILLIEYFQRAKLSTHSITYHCWYNWRTFWRINAGRGKGTKGALFLHDKPPAHQALCNPAETDLSGLPLSWSPAIFSGSGPVGLPPVPWTEKTIERSPFLFRRASYCCRNDLVGRTTFWFWVACKS